MPAPPLPYTRAADSPRPARTARRCGSSSISATHVASAAARRPRSRARSRRPARRLGLARRPAARRRRRRRRCSTPSWLQRPPVPGASLADWLQRRQCPPSRAVPAAIVERLLAGIACGRRRTSAAEAWVAPDGRFRLGALAGAWAKAAGGLHRPCRPRRGAPRSGWPRSRSAWRSLRARTRSRGSASSNNSTPTGARPSTNGAARPSDEPLRQALHLHAAACAREFADRPHAAGRGRDRSAARPSRHQHAARERLQRDAADLRLPLAADALARHRSCAASAITTRSTGWCRPRRSCGVRSPSCCCSARARTKRWRNSRSAKKARREPHRSRRSAARASRCCARRSAPRSRSLQPATGASAPSCADR